MLTGRGYRLNLSDEQAARCEEFGRVCRAVRNTGLEQRRAYRRRGAWVNYRQQAAELAESESEHEWLNAAPGHCLQQILMDLDKACRTHGTRKVRWRSARRWEPSFRFPEGNKMLIERLNRRWGRVRLPKLGWVTFRISHPLGGVVRSATVSRDGNHWYVSFVVDDGKTTPKEHAWPDPGVDRGVVVAVACSDGWMRDRRFTTRGEIKRHRRLQQKLARQKKGSASRRQTLAAMRSIRGRERDRRADFCAWTAHRLTERNALVVLEDLRTRNMTRNAKGTVEQPGSNVKAKAGLNRSILGRGWWQLATALKGRAHYSGTTVVEVPARFTSQTCSACAAVDPGSREGQARFRCTHCGHTMNADVNAARNILAAGLAVTACGDLDAGRSVKQEPAGNREELLLQPT
ncbi:RNA-guided endonuclease InsQ/TnpB family protein [Nocardia pseudovaccinii]|uniref:RNA-guided endonuclease InsQ/TnpB family protein n=1 Tax=Nocardia pseudovaccinii TaxID=189540 RepID=UPI0007A394B7|nr:RNA-guided endonuclease TnpB family protein [Nocardia pseudovaccinii]